MNLEAMIAKFAAMRAEAKRRQRELVTKITFIAEAESKIVTPVDTGTLRRSLNSRIVSDIEGRVGTNIVYARWVHDGTVNMVGRPFFAQGMAATLPQVEALLKEAGEHIVGSVVGE